MSAAFPETQWSQLLELHDPAHPRRQQILERLAFRYWKPVYHYVRALRPVSTADAEDLTQQFFATLLQRGDFDRLSPERGSFRGFLKTALRNFLVSADRATRARPPLFPFAEAEASFEPRSHEGPEQAFDREWARGLLVEAIGGLKDELGAAGRAAHFEVFEAYCLADEDTTYAAVAATRGMSEDDVRNRLREARQKLREILRRRLKEYLGPSENIEKELDFILSA